MFRSAFIVGHPGETNQDFDELLEFVRWAELDHVGVFRYSPEESTPSGEMDAEVPAKVAAARHRKLMSAQRPISRKKLKAMVGREIEVLVEGPSSESEYLFEGRWWGQAPEIDGKVILANGEARPGEIRKAWVTAAADYDLVADLYDADGNLAEPPPGAPKRRVRLPTVGR